MRSIPKWLSLTLIATLGISLQTFNMVSASASTTWPETTGGVAHTWTNYTNAGGTEGPQIASHATVQIACRVQGFTVANGNTWWYRIASPPWNSNFYVSADAFYNGAPTSGSLAGTPFVDPAVVECGAAPPNPPPPPSPAPKVSLSQGSQAGHGYQYQVTLSGFSSGSLVQVSCHDSVDPSGFYTFRLSTHSDGSSSTDAQCYSNDGPDHWVLANGIESNHVRWAASEPPETQTPPSQSTPPKHPQSSSLPSPDNETCPSYEGVRSPASRLSVWLIGRFEGGYSDDVVVPWEYFSGNPQFVARAKSVPVGGEVVWRAVIPSDMFFAIGNFTIKHPSVDCYTIYDLYDFAKRDFPFWLQQELGSAIPFDVQSSGSL